MQFCFSVKNQKMLLAVFAPNQHAAALVEDCRGVNHALFLYGVVHLSQKTDFFCTVNLSKKGKKDQSTSWKSTIVHFHKPIGFIFI